jgi:hypothetical protein
VIISINDRKKIFHRKGCFYEKRILPKNKMEITEEKALKSGYCGCKYCSGLKGYKRLSAKIEKKKNLKIMYDGKTDTLYITTEIGAWKIFKVEKLGILLYHRNFYLGNENLIQLINSKYHRQKDVGITKTLDQIVNYIRKHDTAKMLINAGEIKRLPKSTKKERRYYRKAVAKDRRIKQKRYAVRMEYLFGLVENDEILKQAIV